jgi:CRISPR/Cas system CMR-associated protein Cmr5 small subunit
MQIRGQVAWGVTKNEEAKNQRNKCYKQKALGSTLNHIEKKITETGT